MTSARSDTRTGAPGPPRQDCTRCAGLGRTSATGPRCPHCQGRGLEPLPRVVAPPRTVEQQRLLSHLAELADQRDALGTDHRGIGELNAGPIRDAIIAARDENIAVKYVTEALRISRQRCHQIEYGLLKGERRWA